MGALCLRADFRALQESFIFVVFYLRVLASSSFFLEDDAAVSQMCLWLAVLASLSFTTAWAKGLGFGMRCPEPHAWVLRVKGNS